MLVHFFKTQLIVRSFLLGYHLEETTTLIIKSRQYGPLKNARQTDNYYRELPLNVTSQFMTHCSLSHYVKNGKEEKFGCDRYELDPQQTYKKIVDRCYCRCDLCVPNILTKDLSDHPCDGVVRVSFVARLAVLCCVTWRIRVWIVRRW